MKPSHKSSSCDRNLHSDRHNRLNDRASDIDNSVDTTPSNHINGPLHLLDVYNEMPLHLSSNAFQTTRTTTKETTPTGEGTKERPPNIDHKGNRSAAVIAHSKTNSHFSNNNEFDITLTSCHDDNDDEGDHNYDHVRKSYHYHVNGDLDDELQDAVSILSDDNIFDQPTQSTWCCIRNSRTLICVQLLICVSIIISIILAGVCSSGSCGRNDPNINATSFEFNNNGTLCDDKSLSPTACQQSQANPMSVPQPSININTPASSPIYEEYAPPFAFTSTQELYDAVDEYFVTGTSNPIYGRTIGSWNISLLTNLSHVFNAYDRNPLAMYFNENLTGWDTSRVTTMDHLFFDARAFNGDLSTWQTGNVITMFEMFGRAVSFNGDISNWDVSKVTSIARMFGRVTNFNRNLRRWNVSSVEDMAFTFTNCLSFQGLGLDTWDTSKVHNMEGMFLNTPSFNGDLSLWNVSRVTNMRKTFRQATSFNSVLSQWDVSRVTDMTEMFMHALSFNADISTWNVSSVEYAPLAFYAASNFRADLSNWNVSNMKDVTKIFAAAKNQDHSYCRWGQVLPKDAVTQSMFIASGCPNPIDPHHASAGDRLTFCTTCTDYFNFTIAPTASPSLIDPITPINGSFLPILDQAELFRAIDAYVENGTSSGVLELYGYPIGNWDVSQVTDFSYAFASDRNVKVCAFNEDIGMWNTSEAVSMSFMFAGAALFTQDISSWITNKVTNMTGMFMGADLFDGDLSLWDTSAVNDMSLMFQSALTFKGIGLSNWDTSSVTTLFATFEEAGSFIGNISTWDTSNVVDMQRTFQYSSSFNGDISQWTVSNVLCFSYAFSGASSFNRDLSLWDVSAAHSMIGMFSSAKAFNNDLCSWGPLLNVSLVPTGNLTRGMFTSSACLDTRDPSLANVTEGPFCRDCSA